MDSVPPLKVKKKPAKKRAVTVAVKSPSAKKPESHDNVAPHRSTSEVVVIKHPNRSSRQHPDPQKADVEPKVSKTNARANAKRKGSECKEFESSTSDDTEVERENVVGSDLDSPSVIFKQLLTRFVKVSVTDSSCSSPHEAAELCRSFTDTLFQVVKAYGHDDLWEKIKEIEQCLDADNDTSLSLLDYMDRSFMETNRDLFSVCEQKGIFCEKQRNRECTRHATNNLVGHALLTQEDMTKLSDSMKNTLLNIPDIENHPTTLAAITADTVGEQDISLQQIEVGLQEKGYFITYGCDGKGFWEAKVLDDNSDLVGIYLHTTTPEIALSVRPQVTMESKEQQPGIASPRCSHFSALRRFKCTTGESPHPRNCFLLIDSLSDKIMMCSPESIVTLIKKDRAFLHRLKTLQTKSVSILCDHVDSMDLKGLKLGNNFDVSILTDSCRRGVSDLHSKLAVAFYLNKVVKSPYFFSFLTTKSGGSDTDSCSTPLDLSEDISSGTSSSVMSNGSSSAEESVLIASDVEATRDTIATSNTTNALDEHQQSAYTRALGGESLFITGGAGSGKSFVVQSIIKELKANGKRLAVVAPTELAALVYEDGMTISRFLKHSSKTVPEFPFTLLVDEISMCRPDDFEQLMELVGDKQVIVVGDVLQLPYIPIVGKEQQKKNVKRQYLFDTKVWKRRFPQKNCIYLRSGSSMSNSVNICSNPPQLPPEILCGPQLMGKGPESVVEISQSPEESPLPRIDASLHQRKTSQLELESSESEVKKPVAEVNKCSTLCTIIYCMAALVLPLQIIFFALFTLTAECEYDSCKTVQLCFGGAIYLEGAAFYQWLKKRATFTTVVNDTSANNSARFRLFFVIYGLFFTLPLVFVENGRWDSLDGKTKSTVAAAVLLPPITTGVAYSVMNTYLARYFRRAFFAYMLKGNEYGKKIWEDVQGKDDMNIIKELKSNPIDNIFNAETSELPVNEIDNNMVYIVGKLDDAFNFRGQAPVFHIVGGEGRNNGQWMQLIFFCFLLCFDFSLAIIVVVMDVCEVDYVYIVFTVSPLFLRFVFIKCYFVHHIVMAVLNKQLRISMRVLMDKTSPMEKVTEKKHQESQTDSVDEEETNTAGATSGGPPEEDVLKSQAGSENKIEQGQSNSLETPSTESPGSEVVYECVEVSFTPSGQMSVERRNGQGRNTLVIKGIENRQVRWSMDSLKIGEDVDGNSQQQIEDRQKPTVEKWTFQIKWLFINATKLQTKWNRQRAQTAQMEIDQTNDNSDGNDISPTVP